MKADRPPTADTLTPDTIPESHAATGRQHAPKAYHTPQDLTSGKPSDRQQIRNAERMTERAALPTMRQRQNAPPIRKTSERAKRHWKPQEAA